MLVLDVGSLIAHLRLDTKQYETMLLNAERKLELSAKKMETTGRRLTTRLTAPIAGVMALSVRSYAKFEEQLAMVSTMLDDQTMKYMPAYSQTIKDMSVDFGEATGTLAKGLYDILSASIAPSKALDVLSVATLAAKAGMTDTGVAADAITSILNSYSLSADKAGYVSDILFATVKRGKTTFAELAPNIGVVASIAATAGLELEQVGAALATMTRAGLQTDIAITSLRGVINAFLKPGDEAIKMAENFGIKLNTATLRSVGLTGVLEKLSEASLEQLAVMIPNVRALAGFAAALKQAKGMGEDLELMFKSLGLSQEAYDKMTQTLTHDLKQMWQGLKIVSVEIGEVLRPYMEAVTAKTKEFVRWWRNLDESTQKLYVDLLLLAATLGPLLWMTGKITLGLIAMRRAMLGSAVATGILSKAVGSLILVLGAIKLGTYLHKEYKVVQEYAAVIAEFFMKVQVWVPGLIKILIIETKIMWTRLKGWVLGMIADVIEQAAWSVSKIEGLYEKLFFTEKDFGSAALVQAAADMRTDVTDEVTELEEEWRDILKGMGEELDALTQATDQRILEIGESFDNLNKDKEKDGLLGTENLDAEVEKIQKIVDGVNQTGKTLSANEQTMRDMLDALEAEKKLVGMTNFERERALDLIRFKKVAMEEYKDATGEYYMKVLEYEMALDELAGLQRQAERFEQLKFWLEGAIDWYGNLENVAVTSLDRVSASLTKLVMEGKADFKALAKSILADLTQMIIKMMMARALMSMFGGFGMAPAGGGNFPVAAQGLGDAWLAPVGAKGLVFDMGHVIPMRAGGFLNQPTLFGTSDRKIALAGEAGTEAVMPLTRGQDGRLGVKAEGAVAPVVNTKIVNVYDQSTIIDAMQSNDGETVVLNVLRRQGLI
jgi:TP901 family phage tail tape measure protein